jgi:putative glycosyltransferase (TIGR04372 family)
MTSRGYYVIRMGALVNEKMNTQNPRIIDYATNGSRSDFMDIFLGAKCTFCISTSTGFDAIPTIFRKPIVFITVPIGYIYTFSKKFISITKHHISASDGHELSLDEIFDKNLAYAQTSDEYKNNGVYLVENSPEEIRDVVIEMDDRIKGHWIEKCETEQNNFKNSFLKNLKKDQKKLHGNFDSLFGSKFLEKNSFSL